LPAAGIDYAWALPGQPSDAALHAAGVTFVARYLSTVDKSKCITAAEAARHLAAGRGVVLVYEDDAQAMLRGRAGGIADATAADAQARAAGLGGGVIYFAADWDVTPAQQARINDYLSGAASVIGRGNVGCYGGYWVVSRARAAGKAAYFWGTPAWSGGNWDTCGWKPHIMQGVTTTIGGVSCDWDTAWADDYGQHPRPGQPAAGWTETLVNQLPTLAQDAADRPGAVQFVRRMQALVKVVGDVNGLGPASAVAADGAFGAATRRGLVTVQAFFGLAQDGICGPRTWAALVAGQRP
jgi:peptidoglycan hydrolase-like protein with peptidoglycan-binding domain